MFVHRLHRQHSSVVMTVPKLVCEDLGMCAGDYVVLSKNSNGPGYILQKFESEDIRNAIDGKCTDRRHPGGRT